MAKRASESSVGTPAEESSRSAHRRSDYRGPMMLNWRSTEDSQGSIPLLS